jgi:hypothetical protein
LFWCQVPVFVASGETAHFLAAGFLPEGSIGALEELRVFDGLSSVRMDSAECLVVFVDGCREIGEPFVARGVQGDGGIDAGARERGANGGRWDGCGECNVMGDGSSEVLVLESISGDSGEGVTVAGESRKLDFGFSSAGGASRRRFGLRCRGSRW